MKKSQVLAKLVHQRIQEYGNLFKNKEQEYGVIIWNELADIVTRRNASTFWKYEAKGTGSFSSRVESYITADVWVTFYSEIFYDGDTEDPALARHPNEVLEVDKDELEILIRNIKIIKQGDLMVFPLTS